MWVCNDGAAVYSGAGFNDVGLEVLTGKLGELKLGDKVTVLRVNALNRSEVENYVSEIEYNGGKGLVAYNNLSSSYVEPKWAEPRERKDLEEIQIGRAHV